MVAFNTIKVGDTLWDVHSVRAGNTTTSRMGSWPVGVAAIDVEGRRIFASWNGNTPRWMGTRQIGKLRRSPYKPREPKTVTA